MDYRKFSRGKPRLLVMESQYWVDKACIRAARALGWDVASTPVAREGVMARELIERFLLTLTEFKPDFVLSINLAGMDTAGLFVGLLEDLSIPHVTWFVDDPRTILMEQSTFANAWTVAITWERCYLPFLKTMPFLDVVHMPLAADVHLFNDVPRAATLPASFVGTAMRDNARLAWSELIRHPDVAIRCLDELNANSISRESFRLGLESVFDVATLAEMDAETRRHAEIYFFAEGTRRLREKLVLALESDDFIVYGSEDWKEITPRWHSPVDYDTELAAIYRDSLVNVNTTSIQMPTAVNQRVFDCPGAGGFLLTDAQESLAELFEPGTEVAIYRDIDECVEQVRRFREDSALRNKIATNGHARILAEHTYEHRLKNLYSVLTSHFA